jgi:hypothetical protein
MIVGQQTAESGELGKQTSFRSWGLTPDPWTPPRHQKLYFTPTSHRPALAPKHVDA